MPVGRKIEDEREAVRCLRAAEREGVSGGEWARAHGVDGRSLHAWQMNLARRGTAQDAAEASADGARTGRAPAWSGADGTSRRPLRLGSQRCARRIRRRRSGRDAAPGARGATVMLSFPPTVRRRASRASARAHPPHRPRLRALARRRTAHALAVRAAGGGDRLLQESQRSALSIHRRPTRPHRQLAHRARIPERRQAAAQHALRWQH